MVTEQAVLQATRDTEADDGYPAFRDAVAARVTANTAGHMFTTDADPDVLWETFYEALPAGHRKHYDCRCCRDFVKRYGGLVTIDPAGRTNRVVWPAVEAESYFAEAVTAVTARVNKAKVTGVFASPLQVWGTRANVGKDGRTWTHLSGSPARFRADTPTEDAGQYAARLKQDHGVLLRSLAEYPKVAAVQAIRVLESDAVDRPAAALDMARWFLALYDLPKGRTRDNLLWAAVAFAPAGWCHVKTSVLSTLLDDVVAGLPFDQIKRRWDEKLHPLKYRRPTATPTDGQVAAAERTVEKLGIAPALARRYATLEDVKVKLWTPTPIPQPRPAAPGRVFDHLRGQASPGGVKEVQLPPAKTTWVKFARDVLPTAAKVELKVPAWSPAWYGLLTAADPAAPPILQWDEPADRNPVSWFFRHSRFGAGIPAADWSLTPGAWAEVAAVFALPCHWKSEPNPRRFAQFPDVALLALAGAIPVIDGGSGLFPEMLRSELHGARAVVEAHSNKTVPSGREAADANGLAVVSDDKQMGYLLRATDRAGGTREYVIERWE